MALVSDMFSFDKNADDDAMARRSSVAADSRSQISNMMSADNTPVATKLGATTMGAGNWSYSSGGTVGGGLKIDPFSSLFNANNNANSNSRFLQVK